MKAIDLFPRPHGRRVSRLHSRLSAAFSGTRADRIVCSTSRLFLFLAAAIPAAAIPGTSRGAEPSPGAVILRDLRDFQQMGTVLHIAAHPDDENTQLITYLARGRHYRAGYLSITRGDGGQNVLGPEFGEELGVARTQELLAARRLDGGRQFFTRAIDFGFSKDYRETLRIWDKQQTLSDVVRVIREFRPDVIVTRFSTRPGNTHGHHTSSALLALEAFKLAGDPKAFPEQLGALTPWQPRRIFMNSGGFGRGGGGGTDSAPVRMDISGTDPVTGETFAEIAGRSRAMHKTQGFGNFGGGGRGGGARSESFQLLDGEPATKDIMDGIDTTWARVSGGAEVARLVDEAIAKFNPQDVSASVPALLDLKKRVAALPTDPVVAEKCLKLDQILQACLGLVVETVIPQAEVVPGEQLKLRHTITERSKVPVRWVGVRYPSVGRELKEAKNLTLDRQWTLSGEITLPANTPLSQPYWLREPPSTGMFRVDDPALIGRPENPPVFPIEMTFAVGSQTLVVQDEPVQTSSNPDKSETRRHLTVVPPVSLRCVSGVELFAPGASREVEIEVAAFRAGAAGTAQLDSPADWRVTPAKQSFRFASVGEKVRFKFTVTAPSKPATADITARAEVNGVRFTSQRIEIHYAHIPLQILLPTAQTKAVSLDLAVKARRVGYLPGAGDSVGESLREMGCQVTQLTGADLTPEGLRGLDAVVIGIRAFNVRTDLAAGMPALFAYVEAGGNVIEQYNRPGALNVSRLAPFDLQLSGDRVTDETAPVTFLAPDHPALNVPNKITSADFEGWVQERGVYFPSRWDEHFTPILACNDPGESPLKGGLLVARYGRGYFVYTGLAWFRQLPEGVPGAFRLFANLVSLGQ
jgi:LmbE family N-acetylglucosaminyl deacetylase